MDHMVERLVERTEIYVNRVISDSYKKIEESIEHYRDVVKTVNSKYDGYDILEKRDEVKKEIDELNAIIRDSSDAVKKIIRKTAKSEAKKTE